MAKTVKKKQALQTSRFSEFFRNASSEEKNRVIKEVIRETNNDQRRLMEEAVAGQPNFEIDEKNWEKVKPAIKKARAS